MTIEDIAAGLGKELGIGLNVVDDSFAMDFGGMPFVVMRLDGERGEMLTVACDLGEIPPQSPGKLYEALLNANWAYRGAAGAVLARNPGDGHIWLQDSMPFASLRVEDLLKAMLADFGARVPYENKRNMLKTVAEMTDAGTVAELGRILKDAEEAIESGMMEDMVATERFTNKDLHPLELRKLKVLDTIDRQLGAIGRDELDASGRAEVLDYISEWGDIENGECPNLEANINKSTVDYIKKSMDGKGSLDYRIAPSRSIPAIWGLNSESTSNSFGKVYCECTFTVTGIGTGNPQLTDTKISQTFNMDPE